MKIIAIAVAFAALASTSNTQPGIADYVINAALFTSNPQEPGSLVAMAKPVIRTVSGRSATMALGDDNGGISLDVMASDLGAGKIGLHVVAETRLSGRAAKSTFDLLTGTGAAPATAVLRDSAGALMLMNGRPLYVALEATRRQ